MNSSNQLKLIQMCAKSVDVTLNQTQIDAIQLRIKNLNEYLQNLQIDDNNINNRLIRGINRPWLQHLLRKDEPCSTEPFKNHKNKTDFFEISGNIY